MYRVYSEITGNKVIFETEDKEKAKDFCYSQNKNLYPKEIMTLSPLYCFIREEIVKNKKE